MQTVLYVYRLRVYVARYISSACLHGIFTDNKRGVQTILHLDSQAHVVARTPLLKPGGAALTRMKGSVKLSFWLLFPLSIHGNVASELVVHVTNIYITFSAIVGDVDLIPSVLTTVNCGGVASIVCHATGTNMISFAVANATYSFGSHTFERNSPRSAKVGPLELTLLKAVADPQNAFLTTFNVNGSEKHMTSLMINCTDAKSTRYVEIKTMSKLVIYILKQFTDCLYIFRSKLQCTCALG